MSDLEPWPVCFVPGCGEEFDPERQKLGYVTCLNHSHRDPNNAMPPLILMDVNKSNPTITRSPKGFVTEPYASRPVQVDLRQTRAYIRLNSVDKEESHL